MKNKACPLFMGIDTSVYTASIGLILDNGEIFSDKQVIKLPKGQRDIKQSMVIFKHLRSLPIMLGGLNERYDLTSLKAIAVSAKPRPIESSYMPVFEAGRSIARAIACSLDIPLYEMSHQENHIEAILTGSRLSHEELKKPFLAVHFSGEESEILIAKVTSKGYKIERVAGSLDLDAGMLIDRIGIRFDLNFPAGAELEEVALKAKAKNIKIPSHLHLDNKNFHFSVQENYICNLIRRGVPRAEIAYGLFKMIAKTLYKSIKELIDELEFSTIVFSGGVMSNQIIRHYLIRKLKKKGFNLLFAPPEFCSDNAIGNASLARRIYLGS